MKLKFRDMRRSKQLLSNKEVIQILEKGTSGTLALLGEHDYPYALPISYVYADGKIFFHSANEGHKMNAIRTSDKASFCVIDEDTVIPERYTTHYRSVIAFGRISIIEDAGRKQEAIEKLIQKYCPNETEANVQEKIRQTIPIFA